METWLGGYRLLVYSEVFSFGGLSDAWGQEGELLIHTGAIDGMWRLCKESVPNIMKFVRQWRWHQNKDDLLTKLGQKLSHRLWWRCWRMKQRTFIGAKPQSRSISMSKSQTIFELFSCTTCCNKPVASMQNTVTHRTFVIVDHVKTWQMSSTARAETSPAGWLSLKIIRFCFH